MNQETKQHLWRHCASFFLSAFPYDMTKEEMNEIMEEGDTHPRASEIVVWQPFEGDNMRSVLKTIDCAFRALLHSPFISVVSKEFEASAEELARYVNYNGEEDDSYRQWLVEGNDPSEHIAYHAAAVGGWDDLVYEKFQKEIYETLEAEKEEETSGPVG